MLEISQASVETLRQAREEALPHLLPGCLVLAESIARVYLTNAEKAEKGKRGEDNTRRAGLDLP